MTEKDFELKLRSDVAEFCKKHGQYRAEIHKLAEPYEYEAETVLFVPAYEVTLLWAGVQYRDARIRNDVTEFADLLRTPPYAVIDNDGAPLPSSFIWTVAWRELLGTYEKASMNKYQAIFESVTSDPEYLSNLDWGEAREGHPEGTVRAHIAEIEPNLEKLRPRLSEEEYWKLKLLVHVHDNFKATAKAGVAIADPHSHASLARAFLAGYCDDADLLAMVQYHDEPFALYRQFLSKGKYNQERFAAMVAAIRDWNLFLAFNIIDGCTAGKSREPLHWLFREIAGKVHANFSEADIIE